MSSMDHCAQPGILEPVPSQGRYVLFFLQAQAAPDALCDSLRRLVPRTLSL